MIQVDTLEKIQARNRVLLEEMGQEAQRFIELLTIVDPINWTRKRQALSDTRL
jgi:hypothetical protein